MRRPFLPPVLAAVILVPTPSFASDDLWGPRKPGWADIVVTAFAGDGIRFNNPYRLATVLGSQAQSLSRTASYADAGLNFLFTDPTRLTAGIALRTSFALEGVQQAVMTPSFLLMERWSRWGLYGRAGIPVVATPDVTWGWEGGAGAVLFLTAGVGMAAELVGDVFYGAGTREVAVPAYPVLSGQGGLWLSWEMLP
jgi:hypothetical protein